jgi:protein SMG8
LGDDGEDLKEAGAGSRHRSTAVYHRKQHAPTPSSSWPSFRDFVFSHVNAGFTHGFDDNVGRHGHQRFFVLPTASAWAEAAAVLYEFLVGKAAAEVKEAAVRVVDVEAAFSEARCERVLPLALAAYQENLPHHYSEVVHAARVRNAKFKKKKN